MKRYCQGYALQSHSGQLFPRTQTLGWNQACQLISSFRSDLGLIFLHTFLLRCTASNLTMLACFSSFNSLISRIAVTQMPSPSCRMSFHSNQLYALQMNFDKWETMGTGVGWRGKRRGSRRQEIDPSGTSVNDLVCGNIIASSHCSKAPGIPVTFPGLNVLMASNFRCWSLGFTRYTTP